MLSLGLKIEAATSRATPEKMITRIKAANNLKVDRDMANPLSTLQALQLYAQAHQSMTALFVASTEQLDEAPQQTRGRAESQSKTTERKRQEDISEPPAYAADSNEKQVSHVNLFRFSLRAKYSQRQAKSITVARR